MSAPEFTDTGLTIQTYQAVFDELVADLQTVYGDINLDSNTPDGQRVGIIAKLQFDLQVFALAFYNGLDKNLATGEQLKIIGKISGVRPRPATQSTWDLSVTSSVAFTLPATFTIKDTQGYEWSPEEEVNITSGAQTVTFKSVLFGAIPGDSAETFTQETVEPNITAISASGDATEGLPETTDAEYRVILNQSTENPSFSTRGKMLAALYAITGVTNVKVHENFTTTTDSTGTLAHTIWCIVEGGTVADIAETIMLNKTAGTGLRGAVTEEVTEVITLDNGLVINISHTVVFDRPTEVPLYVRANVTNKAGYSTIDTDLIKTKIAATKYLLQDSAEATQLYASGYQAGTTFVLTDMEISRDNVTYTDGELVAATNEKYTISTDNITLTEV